MIIEAHTSIERCSPPGVAQAFSTEDSSAAKATAAQPVGQSSTLRGLEPKKNARPGVFRAIHSVS